MVDIVGDWWWGCAEKGWKMGENRGPGKCFRGRQVGAFSVFSLGDTGTPFIFWPFFVFFTKFCRFRGWCNITPICWAKKRSSWGVGILGWVIGKVEAYYPFIINF